MREIMDAAGRQWDVVIGKESWGTLVVLFSPRVEGSPRKSTLRAETAFDAERVLAAMSEEELLSLLATSEPWS
jgi:hypothetical protein